MSTLVAVTNQLATLNATSTDTLTVAEKIQELLEGSAAEARAAARNAREAASESRGGGRQSRIGEGISNFGNAAASIGGGLAGLGAGIAGFMAALAVGSVGLDWIGADYSGLGRAFASFSEAMENLSPAAIVAIAGASVIAAKTSSFRNLYGLGTASSMTGLGAGIAGFLIGLSLGEVGLSWVGQDYTNLGQALASFSTAITSLTPEAMATFGVLAGVAGGLSILRNPLRFALSMTAVSAGIAGFLIGLSLTDAGIGWIQSVSGADGSALVSAFKMFNDAIMSLTPMSVSALAALMGIATAFTLPVGRIILGMTGVGVGISAFMLSLALGDAGINWIQEVSGADGSAMVSVMKMFNEVVNALDTKAIATLGVLLGLSLAFGPGAAVALGTMGLGIAAFMVSLALGDGITQLISMATGGEPGAALKTLMINIFDGVAAVRVLEGIDLIYIGAGLTALAAGLASFGVGAIISGLGQAVQSLVAFFTGESVFDQIMSIADNADGLMKGATALEKIAEALQKFGGISLSDIEIDFEELATELGKAVPFLDALANGGVVEGSAGWFGSDIEFKKGILDPSLRLDEMADAIAKVNYVLGRSDSPNVSAAAPQAMPSIGAADIQPVPVEDRQIPALVQAITAAQPTGGARSGGGGASQTVHTATEESTMDVLDARSARGGNR